MDRTPEPLGEIERVWAALWARLTRDATDDDDEGDRAVVYLGEPIRTAYVLIERDHLAIVIGLEDARWKRPEDRGS